MPSVHVHAVQYIPFCLLFVSTHFTVCVCWFNVCVALCACLCTGILTDSLKSARTAAVDARPRYRCWGTLEEKICWPQNWSADQTVVLLGNFQGVNEWICMRWCSATLLQKRPVPSKWIVNRSKNKHLWKCPICFLASCLRRRWIPLFCLCVWRMKYKHWEKGEVGGLAIYLFFFFNNIPNSYKAW